MGSAKAPPTEPLWLDSAQSLDQWLDNQPRELPLGMDSEFERVNTFFPIPGLVQISAGSDVRLIEPSAAAASQRFRALLEEADRPKLFYAMSEDLELLREWLGVTTQGVIDLQIAAAFCGHGLSKGYTRLVEELMGVTLSKEQTRSDWLARPLSLEQQQYAMADVYYLLPLYERLRESLEANGFLQAALDESEQARARQATREAPEIYYLRLRSGWRLSSGRQALLAALCAWRERRCRELDRPRGRVLSDQLLLSIAQTVPRDARTLAGVEGMPAGVVRREGDRLLAVIEDVVTGEPASISAIPPPLSRHEQQCFRSVKGVIRAAAEARDLALELVAPRRYLEPAVREGLATGRVPPFLAQGWRGALLNDYHEELTACFHD